MINKKAKPSYGWCNEDVLLYRVFKNKLSGFYLEIGSFDATAGSITKVFSDMGWCGVNVEPNPILAENIRKQRPRDITVEYGVSNIKGQLDFFEIVDELTLSTFSIEQAEALKKQGKKINVRKIATMTLEDICDLHVKSKEIDFLVIDVEGYEFEVIKSGNWNKWRPTVLIIESTEPLSNKLVHQNWEPIILGSDYSFAFFDGFNRFYVRNENKEMLPLLSYPANKLDDLVYYEVLDAFDKASKYSYFSRITIRIALCLQFGINLLKRFFYSARK